VHGSEFPEVHEGWEFVCELTECEPFEERSFSMVLVKQLKNSQKGR
jgi:hypothetical protein